MTTLHSTLTAAKTAWLDEDPGEFAELLQTAYDLAVAAGDDDTADAIANLWTDTPDDPVTVLDQMLAVLEDEHGDQPFYGYSTPDDRYPPTPGVFG